MPSYNVINHSSRMIPISQTGSIMIFYTNHIFSTKDQYIQMCIRDSTNTFVSLNLQDQYETTPLHVDVNIVSNDILDVEAFQAWRPEYNDAEFILEEGKYICGGAVEKMSKSMYNVCLLYTSRLS